METPEHYNAIPKLAAIEDDLQECYSSSSSGNPYRRLKKSVFQLGGLKTKYLRFYSVLPNMNKRDFEKNMQKVRQFARSL